MGLEDGLAVQHTEEYGYGYKRARSRLFFRSEKRGCLPNPQEYMFSSRIRSYGLH